MEPGRIEQAVTAPNTDAARDAEPVNAPVGNLGHRASRGVMLTLGGQWSKTLIQLASTVVLAR